MECRSLGLTMFAVSVHLSPPTKCRPALLRRIRTGLERPLWSFGHRHLAKSGVAPAQSGVSPVSKCIVA